MERHGALMPEFIFTSPEGKKLTVTGPEGSTVEDAFERVKSLPPSGKEPNISLSDIPLQALGSAPADALEVAKGIVHPFIHPIDTAKTVGKIGLGLGEKISRKMLSSEVEEGPHEQFPDAIAAMFKEEYGGWENIKRSLATHPVRTLADLSALATGGETILGRLPGMLGKAGEVAGTVGRAVDPIANVGRAVSLAGKGVAATGVPQTVAGIVRGRFDPEGEAATRLESSIERSQPSGRRLTEAQFNVGKATDEPVMLGDLGSAPTKALMRSAANTSEEARDLIEEAVGRRFLTQSERASKTVRGMVPGGADAFEADKALKAKYDAERGKAYKSAYDAGDRPIWSPTLERLTAAPSVTGALRQAVGKWKDWQVLDGYGAANPPVKITPDGRLLFGGKGLNTYPNLQLWDYASRVLAGKAAKARRDGDTELAARYGGLEKALKTELDRMVPEFREARGIASTYFGGENVLEAGEASLNFNRDIRELQQVMGKMKPAERELFRNAHADALSRKLTGTSDRFDVTRRLMNSVEERRKIEAIHGPQGARELEARVWLEGIFDDSRKALGNSTTARQLMELGHAGGGVGAVLGKLNTRSIMEGIAGRLAGFVDKEVARRVAELAVSNNIGKLKGDAARVAARDQKTMDALRTIGNRMGSAARASNVLRGTGTQDINQYLSTIQ
jgi:hypothetical protein